MNFGITYSLKMGGINPSANPVTYDSTVDTPILDAYDPVYDFRGWNVTYWANFTQLLTSQKNFVIPKGTTGRVELAAIFDRTPKEIPKNNNDSKENPSTKTSTTKRTAVFISYSHKDKVYLDELSDTLKLLETEHDIKILSDQKLRSGDKWKKELLSYMDAAKIAVLLVSPAFLVSDFIRKEELPKLLEAAEKDNATILWIPVRKSHVEVTGINDYQTAGSKIPLNSMKDHERDEEYYKLYDEIKNHLRD
ncbi:MAG: toll/interleukin-1 receptor domain-containing protein [Nitrososphaerota archaeon]|jgi:hypothetical protein|nr:toll/interleukin-1 receptor domain-containing protein [Nitrososphaerota archaeon]